MARKRSIVVVRTPQQALAYTQAQNAGLAAARASSLAAAKKAKAEIARGKNIGGPPGALEQLAINRKKALPLTTPAQAVFPGSGKVRPRKTVAGPRPSKTGYVGSGSPHPAVGTGPVRAPHPSQHGAPKAVVSGAGQTHHTVPADRKSRPPYGNPAGAKVTTPVVTRPKPTTRPSPNPTPTRSFPDTSLQGSSTTGAGSSSTDPFAGLTPQQIVEQMLAPQYAPLDAQTRSRRTRCTRTSRARSATSPRCCSRRRRRRGQGRSPPRSSPPCQTRRAPSRRTSTRRICRRSPTSGSRSRRRRRS
jgi:hypothetical protein